MHAIRNSGLGSRVQMNSVRIIHDFYGLINVNVHAGVKGVFEKL
jgi:hypothetical protein